MLGGWRDQVDGQETGDWDLTLNQKIEEGLKSFAEKHYDIRHIDWEYQWSGIMASSKTGLPFIGPTENPQIFTCAGFTGHGFSWAHGSAKLLADIMAGNSTPEVVQYFDPCLRG